MSNVTILVRLNVGQGAMQISAWIARYFKYARLLCLRPDCSRYGFRKSEHALHVAPCIGRPLLLKGMKKTTKGESRSPSLRAPDGNPHWVKRL